MNVSIDPIAKVLITVGLIFIVAGVAWQMGWIQQLRLGRLPGDIYIEKENMKFYFPLTTSLLVSAIFALLKWLFKGF